MSTSQGTSNGIKNEEGYIPGTCNIGKKEVLRRRNGAIFAGILAVAVAFLLFYFHADKLWRFLVFAPLASFAIGIQQWYFKFCVGFGMKGIFNFKELGESVSVEEAEMRRLDKAKATRMIVTGILFSLVLTIAFYLLP
jgi:hypothetical protein